jgi:glycosyltransferase involved in cell wall biosynthesis
MNIAVCAGLLYSAAEDKRNIIAETLSLLARQMNEHRFLVIKGNDDNYNYTFPSNVEIIKIGSPGKGQLLRKYWWEIKLPKGLKKVNADVLISFDGLCSTTLSLPQVLIIIEGEKINPRSFKKAKIIIANSQGYKNEWIKQLAIEEEKIEIVPATVNEIYKPLNETEREKVKTKYSDGKEFFLCTGKEVHSETFISLLKSFSYFKKRQQSNTKLLLLTKPDKRSLNSLSTYKYKNDIMIIEDITCAEEAAFTGSSYAVIILPDDRQPVFNSLKALQSGVPLIASGNSTVKDIAGEVALYTENKTEKDVGEKMIRIYADENLRNQLINRGKIVAQNFIMQKTVDGLSRCIVMAVK